MYEYDQLKMVGYTCNRLQGSHGVVFSNYLITFFFLVKNYLELAQCKRATRV